MLISSEADYFEVAVGAETEHGVWGSAPKLEPSSYFRDQPDLSRHQASKPCPAVGRRLGLPSLLVQALLELFGLELRNPKP